MKEMWKNCSHKKQLLLVLSALVLCLSVSVGMTLAYFTDWTAASGEGKVADMKPDTELKEEIQNLDKVITVENTGTAEAFIRVKVFYPNPELNNMEVTFESDEGWEEKDDGYWFYTKVLAGGETTSELKVNVTAHVKADGGTPDFQIIVVHENTPAVYDESGNAQPRDWYAAQSQTEGEEGNE